MSDDKKKTPETDLVEKLTAENERLQQENQTLLTKNAELLASRDKSGSKVADTPPATPPATFEFAGSSGKPFSISGVGFGATPGVLQLAGIHVEPTRWKDGSIKGIVPAHLSGSITVNVNGTTRTVTL